MSDVDIDEFMITTKKVLILLDEIYSKYLQSPGTLTDNEFDYFEIIINSFCTLWWEYGLSSTIKFHFIKKHLFPMFLRYFRWSKEYEELFIERVHHLAKKMEQKSLNVNSYEQKAQLHNKW